MQLQRQDNMNMLFKKQDIGSSNRTPRTFRSSMAVSARDNDSIHGGSDQGSNKSDRGGKLKGGDSVESKETGESLQGKIIRQVQEAMFKKAKHYVGHHVLVKEGVVHMQKAKEKKQLKKYTLKNDEGFAKID